MEAPGCHFFLRHSRQEGGTRRYRRSIRSWDRETRCRTGCWACRSRGPSTYVRCLWSTKWRSEEHTSELQSLAYLVCRLLLEKKKKMANQLFRLLDTKILLADIIVDFIVAPQ